MNRIYQVIWSSVKDCYVVVSENAGRHGKKKAVHLAPSTTKRTMLAMSLGAAVLMGSGAAAEAAATGENATISGGVNGDASGKYSSISGGKDNVASGENSSISGGSTNTATGKNASISGGGDNEAIGEAASVSGGSQGKATGTRASVTGGLQNQAAGEFATVNGGSGNKAFGWGSSIIGGTGNVVGKMAVDENGNPKLKDSKGNDVVATIKTDDKGNTYLVDSKGNVIKDANPYTDPNSFAGSVAVAIGGMSSSVQGNYSVGIAGGSTSEAAWHGLAAGRKATVTMANGVAIGYESTASVINSSRAADKEGRIVSFGHQKGDVYYDVDYQNHTVTEHKYDSAAYNRLVNVADGIDDHDVVVMEQLKNAKAEAVATAKNQIKVKGDEVNVHAEETTDKAGVQTTTISLKPKVTLKESTDTTGAKQVVLDGTAGTISAGLSTDQQNYISLNGTTGVAKVGVVEIGNQSFTYTYDRPDGMNDNGTVKLTSTRATVEGSFVTGLSNKTWTPGNYVTGRAATEDQLEQAGRHFLSIKTAYVDKEDNPITPVAENTLANYYNDGATGSASMAFGVGTTAKGNLSLAMGVNSSASGQNSLAIGYGNEATGTKSVAVGNSSNASGNYSVAMGLGAQAGTKNTDVESTGHGGAVAVGYGAGAAETGSAAYGYSAKANAVESLAFGTSAQANKEGSIALGAHSVANREKGFTGYLAPDMTNPENAAKAETWVSTSGAVSLGGTDAAGTTISRQITNLAAGSEDSDAVNVAQLKALASQGMNFKGNDATTTVHRNLGDTLTIQGTGADGRDYDGGANVQVKADKNANTLTVQLDRDLNAHTLTLGKETKGAEKGEEGSLILNGVNKDNGYSPVSIKAAYKTTEQDTDTSLKTNMSRLTYAVANEGTHTVATLEDGLQLAGDNGETLNTTLDKKVTIKGGVAKDKLVDNTTDPTKNNNIGVVASQDKDGNTTLSLQLAKDIAGLNTVTAGTVVMGYQTVISDQKKSETGSFVTGLGNTTWDGKDYVSGRAATEDQLKRVSDSIQNSVNNAQFGITADGLAAGGDVTIKQNLGSAIRIYGDAPVTNEKNDGSGDFWDRSKANILTKVKKDHDGNDYVSVELQDHLEVGTHAGKDTDGKDVAGVDGSMQFKGASAKEVNITGDTGIALSDGDGSARTVTAALRQDKGTGYLDLAGSEGAFTSLFAKNGKKNLTSDQDSASSTRLTYTNENSNTEHQVATMDDGLVVAGDNGQVTRLLNSTLKLSGGETDETKLSSGQNIGVVANKDKDGLDIKLAKDLTGIDSITGLKNTTIGSDFATQGRAATEEQLKLMQSSITSSITQSAQGGGFALTSDEKGDDKIVKQDLGKAIQIKGDTTYKADGSVEKEGNIKTSIDNGAIKVGLNKDVDLGDDGSIKAGGVTISNKGINAGNKNITNLASGIVNRDDRDNTNAANIGDVKTLAGEVAKTEIGKLGSRDFAGDDEKTVSRGLGESMKLSGGADASKLTGGNIGVVKNAAGDGLDIKMSKELKGLTSVTTGNSTLNNDGLTIKDGEGKAGTTITNSGIKIAANGDNTHAVEVTSSNVSMGGQQIHDVADGQSDGDAVNVSQLKKSVGALGGAIDKVDRRVDRVGAGAAALAALHPQDFDPDDKWDFAVGYGNYRGANAAAVGAFYRPNEDTTFSVGGTVGGGENMVNAGVSFKFGQGNHVSNSRVAMAKEIKDLRKEVESLRSALVDVAAGKQLDPAKTKLFPDMPKNHWAYKEISELAGNGLLDGYPDGEFKGDRMMTRYEFAQIVYNQMMAGRELSDRLVQEFEPELEHIRIDVIARHKDGTPSIERVRVNKPADKNSK